MTSLGPHLTPESVIAIANEGFMTPDMLNLLLDRESGEVRVLLVDDQLMIREVVRRVFAGESDIVFHSITDASLALEEAERFRPTVILQDLVMPQFDGFALLQQYRRSDILRNVPVVVLSTKEEARLKSDCFAGGANDYLIKIPEELELLARVRYHSAGYLNRLQRDRAFAMLHDSQLELAKANIELRKLAVLDPLTGIANRRRFDEAMAIEWPRAQREGRPLSLLMCDIDFFKAYNDTYGHPAGDHCLKQVAAVFTGCLKRPADLATRYGGEEFAIILPETNRSGAKEVAEQCRSQLETLAIASSGTDSGIVTTSVGFATIEPSSSLTVSDLIASADKALYEAKAAGRNRTFG